MSIFWEVKSAVKRGALPLSRTCWALLCCLASKNHFLPYFSFLFSYLTHAAEFGHFYFKFKSQPDPERGVPFPRWRFQLTTYQAIHHCFRQADLVKCSFSRMRQILGDPLWNGCFKGVNLLLSAMTKFASDIFLFCSIDWKSPTWEIRKNWGLFLSGFLACFHNFSSPVDTLIQYYSGWRSWELTPHTSQLKHSHRANVEHRISTMNNQMLVTK